MLDVVTSAATRKSIGRLFPLGSIMSRGSNNPITLHSVDDNIFARIWSLIAETVVANGELSRNTKEKIAGLVSRNECPNCTGLLNMPVEATAIAEGQAEYQKQALEYADKIITATRMRTPISCPSEEEDCSLLNEMAKAEIGLLVLLFMHLKRMVNALIGGETSAALYNVPRPVASVIEGSWFMHVVNRIMKRSISAGAINQEHAMGCTEYLYESEPRDLDAVLPLHLQGSEAAGTYRANALARLVEWEEYFYENHLMPANILPQHIVDFLDDPDNSPPAVYMRFRSPKRVLSWATDTMFPKIQQLITDERLKTLVRILILVSFAPHAVANSLDWKQLSRLYGKKNSRAILIWWSIRLAFKHAKGLSLEDLLQD